MPTLKVLTIIRFVFVLGAVICPLAGVKFGDGRASVIVPCLLGGLVLGTFAIIASYLRWRLAGKPSGIFTALGYIGILILMMGCIITVPGFVKDPTDARRNSCINNLRQLDGAVEVWAQDKHKQPGDVAPDQELFGIGKYLKEKPQCPDGGTYSYGKVEVFSPKPYFLKITELRALSPKSIPFRGILARRKPARFQPQKIPTFWNQS